MSWSWIDRLLGREPHDLKIDLANQRIENAKDKAALNDLKRSSKVVRERTGRLVAELNRVNEQLREQRQPR